MTARTDAALALAHAEARVIEARNALRDAVKAEIAAMPEVGDGEGFHAKVAALAVVLGVPRETAGGGFAWDINHANACISMPQLATETTGLLVTQSTEMASWILRNTTLDAALRLALAWLADRDVFVEARS